MSRPLKPVPSDAPHLLSGSDEGALSWMFRQTISERSTSGYILERQHALSIASSSYVPWPKVVDGKVEYSSKEITARPTCETPSNSRPDPDITDLTCFGWVSRRLMQIGKLHADVLEALLGNSGQRWSITKQGRIVAVFTLTPTGKSLVRASEEQNTKNGAALVLSPAARIEVIVLQATSDAGRREKLERARREAEALVRRAIRAWNGFAEDEDQTGAV